MPLSHGMAGNVQLGSTNHCSYKQRNRFAPRRTAQPVAASSPATAAWDGIDAFTALGDRQDLPPIPLPPLTTLKRIVLVRHGQSSWNAAGIIQGSSDLSVLTEKGQQQARITRDLLQDTEFDALFHSPLERARHTAEIIWGSRDAPVTVLPSLREVDLYEFQGLVKAEGKARFGAEYRRWQQYPHHFQISGHAPVTELWYRASLAWQTLLSTPDSTRVSLVVAHNALNQALLCTALGLAPAHFRRLIQDNGATSVLDFLPASGGGSPQVVLQHTNQAPVTRRSSKARGGRGSLVLVCSQEADGGDGAPSTSSGQGAGSWRQQAAALRAAEALLHHEMHQIFTDDAPSSWMATAVLAGLRRETQPQLDTPGPSSLPDAQGLEGVRQLRRACQEGGVVLVAGEGALRRVVAGLLDLPDAAAGTLRFTLGGISTIEVPLPADPSAQDIAPPSPGEVPMSAKAKLQYFNTTSHLGPWSPALHQL